MPQHGTRAAYEHFGCRCPDAREIRRKALKRKEYGVAKPAFVPAVGTMRRIQALGCLGYSPNRIAEGACSELEIQHIRRGLIDTVTIKIASHVKAFYDLNWDKPLPVSSSAGQQRARARREGWAPPMAWDDIDDPDEVPRHLANDTVSNSVNEDAVDVELLLHGRSRLNIDTPRNASVAVKTHRNRLNRKAIYQLRHVRGVDIASIAERLKMTERQVQRHLAWMEEHPDEVAELTHSVTSHEAPQGDEAA